jgi:hypothetical protein
MYIYIYIYLCERRVEIWKKKNTSFRRLITILVNTALANKSD